MEVSDDLPHCVGRLEIASPKPVGFLCGTLPVIADANSFSLPRSALVPSTSQRMAAPRYQMLPTETDLNSLPLLHIPEKVLPPPDKADLRRENDPAAQNLSRKCEALAVSGLTEYGDEIDVIAPTDIMKQIFKIPYSKARLSIAVHRVGDTLILNTGPDVEEGEKVFRRQTNQSKSSDPSIFLNFAMHSVRAEACDCPPSHYPDPKDRGSTILPGHFKHEENDFVPSPSPHVSKPQFLGRSANNCHSGGYSKGREDKLFWDARSKRSTKRNASIKNTSIVSEKNWHPIQEMDKCRKVGNNGFLRVTFWQFHNFRMLLGSDLLVFSNEKYIAVSLHLWDVAKQVTPLTWLEAWLDNVMASVPEVAICYHQNGVVQGYELLKTDDIFLLKGISDDGSPAFHPQVVQQNGLSVLRFLQANCKQDPGAYWLYKRAGEDVMQLFDLLVIPKKHQPASHDTGCGSFSSLLHKERRNSLFSLGTVLYRVAHRLSLSKSYEDSTKCVGFFKKCLDVMSEQDHLIVRAYAHEQFARFILKCHEELDLTSEFSVLESEVTVTAVKDEDSIPSCEMIESRVHNMVQPEGGGDIPSSDAKLASQSSIAETPGLFNMEAGFSMLRSMGSPMQNQMEDSTSTHRRKSGLAVCQISSSLANLVQTVTDPVSSKLAAINHVCQAIKSLRWKRQLQNTEGDFLDNSKVHDKSAPSTSSVCTCGDADCIEVCDIRAWLPRFRMDDKMWKLVLLLGESYLALGEAYRDDGQLEQALKVVKLASSIYGSMPQQLEGSQFISSMVGSTLSHMKFEKEHVTADFSIDNLQDVKSSLKDHHSSSHNFSLNYLFWVKAWILVGDVHVEYQRMQDKDVPVKVESKRPDRELQLSEEVVREVKRLKKKLSQYNESCSTCSLINCSCRNDRVSSGNSASSSHDFPSTVFGRKQSRKSNVKDSKPVSTLNPEDYHTNGKLLRIDCTKSGNQITNRREEYPNSSEIVSVDEDHCTMETPLTDSGAAASGPDEKIVPTVKYGGIFKFLKGPKVGDTEYNLMAAIECYDAARKAMNGDPGCSSGLHSVLKKRGWVFNELGRCRLNRGDLHGAELAFADAIKAFRKVPDHINIILINCNIGHGRRALAEELVSKGEMLKDHGSAFRQSMRSAKMEYIKSLKYYEAANTELNAIGEEADSLLRNEVHTQFAHTYLRLGMLLSKEDIYADICGKGFFEESAVSLVPNTERFKLKRHDISATVAFREALSLYESLGELRKQEAAFANFQLACYHRDLCLKLSLMGDRQTKHSKFKCDTSQKFKLHASLAEQNWQKALDFYGPRTHPVMYLSILLEQSKLLSSLADSSGSAVTLASALQHLLEGRHVTREEREDFSHSIDDVHAKFLNHLRALLKSMLATTRLRSTDHSMSHDGAANGDMAISLAKLKEMYRISLKSTSFCQLHTLYKLWIIST